MGKPFAAIFNPAVPEGRGEQFILVGICSCRGYVAKREAVRETWMKQVSEHIRPVFFVGEGEGPVEADVVVVRGVPDDYEHLPAKVLGFFRRSQLFR